jgi:hypothetical protein
MISEETPIKDGRRTDGTFATGNRGGPGRPRLTYARDMGDRHDAAWNKVGTPERIMAIVEATFKAAENGDQAAARTVFERMGGPVVARRLVEEVEQIKELIEQLKAQRNGSGLRDKIMGEQ